MSACLSETEQHKLGDLSMCDSLSSNKNIELDQYSHCALLYHMKLDVVARTKQETNSHPDVCKFTSFCVFYSSVCFCPFATHGHSARVTWTAIGTLIPEREARKLHPTDYLTGRGPLHGEWFSTVASQQQVLPTCRTERRHRHSPLHCLMTGNWAQWQNFSTLMENIDVCL